MSHSDYVQRIQESIQQTPMTDRATLEYLSKMLSAVLLGDVTEAEQYFNTPKEPPPHMRLNRREIVVPTFRCGLSQAFYNKALRPGFDKRAMSKSFVSTEVTPEQLIAHILQGNAWTPAIFMDNRRVKQNFISAQLIGLDFDSGISVDDANMELLISEYAALIHPSASSTPEKPKTRVVFILSEPVMEWHRYEALTKAMSKHFSHMMPDEQTKDATRLFYGSDVSGADCFPAAVLPIKLAGTLCVEHAYQDEWTLEQEKVRKAQPPRTFTPAQMNKYVKTAYDNELMLVQTCSVDRHKQLYKSACNIAGMVKGSWGISEGQAEGDLYSAVGAHSMNEHDQKEVLRVIRDAFRTAQPRSLETIR
jgi:hypothetical protein